MIDVKNIQAYLKDKFINVPNEWVDACIHFIQNEYQQQQIQVNIFFTLLYPSFRRKEGILQ